MARKKVATKSMVTESNITELRIEPWQNTVDQAIFDYESKRAISNETIGKRNFMDVGKENRYMMWARLDMAAYEKVIRYCCKLGLDVDQEINHIISFALDYYGEEGANKYQEYVNHIYGRNQEYAPLLINAEDIDNYFSFTASQFGIIYE